MSDKKLFHYRVFYDDHDPDCIGVYKSIDLYFPNSMSLSQIKEYWLKYWAKPCDSMPSWDFIKASMFNVKDSRCFDRWTDLK